MDGYQRNYDLPFENKIDAELDEYYNIEDLYNTEYAGGLNEVFPPAGSFTNLPNELFLSSNVNQEEMVDQYRKFSEYEDMEDLK